MAGIKAPLQDILTKLATLDVTNRDSGQVKLYARVWNNHLQAEQEGKIYDYPKPAAFVEILSPIVFQEIGGNYRSADLGINIHLVHEFYNAEGSFEQDLEIFDLRDKVLALLSQYKPTGCGLMVCVTEEQDYDHGNLYHYVLGFVCNFTDSKGSPYDENAGKYIDKTPPTDVDIQVTTAEQPVFNSISQPYRIPQ